jgi:hypothetical protein
MPTSSSRPDRDELSLSPISILTDLTANVTIEATQANNDHRQAAGHGVVSSDSEPEISV